MNFDWGSHNGYYGGFGGHHDSSHGSYDHSGYESAMSIVKAKVNGSNNANNIVTQNSSKRQVLQQASKNNNNNNNRTINNKTNRNNING